MRHFTFTVSEREIKRNVHFCLKYRGRFYFIYEKYRYGYYCIIHYMVPIKNKKLEPVSTKTDLTKKKKILLCIPK
jgi:hypothetical protein